MPLQLDDLELLDAPPPVSGRPLLLPIDSIEEDPEQPRKEFDDESLRELAATITERGVRQPISVRPHPASENRWILNFGARRLRASRLAGKADIPAFVDEATDSYDQVIENEQREPLKPLELALFVRRRLAAGESQAEIARRLGKSRQYITFATALIDPPDWLLSAYRDGRCRGLTELYELRKLHAERPDRVAALIAENKPVTRERIAALRADGDPANVRDRFATPPCDHWARSGQLTSSLPQGRHTAASKPKGTVRIARGARSRRVRVDRQLRSRRGWSRVRAASSRWIESCRSRLAIEALGLRAAIAKAGPGPRLAGDVRRRHWGSDE